MTGYYILILLALPLLALAAPSINLQPGLGGAIGFGDNDKDNEPDVAGGLGVSVRPNWQLGSNLGQGISSALNGTIQSLADGHRAIDNTVIYGIANATKAALNILSNSGSTLGSAASGVIGALGNSTTALGNSLGPLDAGVGAQGEVALKNAIGKYVGAVLDAGQHPQNAPNVIAALRDVIEVIISNGVSGNGTAYVGPLGSISGGGGLKEAINILTGGLLGGTL